MSPHDLNEAIETARQHCLTTTPGPELRKAERHLMELRAVQLAKAVEDVDMDVLMNIREAMTMEPPK